MPPVANAGANAALTLPDNSTTLNGTPSYDPDGSIVSYAWTKISGPAQSTIATPAAASTIVSNMVAGVYTFQLLVTDNQGATNADTIFFFHISVNQDRKSTIYTYALNVK